MRLEKINTKIVVAVGVSIILILTLVFVIFNTNIIIKHDKKDSNTNTSSNTEVVSEDAKNRVKDVNDLNVEEKKYIIKQNYLASLKDLETTILDQMKIDCIEAKSCPFGIEDYLEYTKEPPTKISGCSGKLSVTFENNEAKVDMSGVNCTSGTNTNYEDPEEPDYGAYDGTGAIPDDVKNRIKLATLLTANEKNYIVGENILADINGATGDTMAGLKDSCVDPKNCDFDSDIYNLYSQDSEKGYFISGCSGKVNVVYLPGVVVVNKNTKGALKVVKDTDNLKANEIRMSDALPRLSSTPLQNGNYVKKVKVKAYTLANASKGGALKVVADTKKPTASEIRFSNVKNRVYFSDIKVGDYVVISDIDAYVFADKSDKDALKVVADFREPKEGEIKFSLVRPLIDESGVKEGDYVTEGKFVTDTSKVVCK